MTNNNLTPEELLNEQQYKAILAKTAYTFTYSQFEELEQIAARYESLNALLLPIADDKPLSSVSCLFESLNESLFEFIAHVEPNKPKPVI